MSSSSTGSQHTSKGAQYLQSCFWNSAHHCADLEPLGQFRLRCDKYDVVDVGDDFPLALLPTLIIEGGLTDSLSNLMDSGNRAATRGAGWTPNGEIDGSIDTEVFWWMMPLWSVVGDEVVGFDA